VIGRDWNHTFATTVVAHGGGSGFEPVSRPGSEARVGDLLVLHDHLAVVTGADGDRLDTVEGTHDGGVAHRPRSASEADVLRPIYK
jgi:hypothetical protein